MIIKVVMLMALRLSDVVFKIPDTSSMTEENKFMHG
jgi:hypothetical protein